MFIKNNWDASVVKNTKTVNMQCSKCDNNSEHSICVEYYGPSVGIIFMKTPLLSMKRYWFACPICGNGTKQITSDQVEAYRIKD